MTQLRLVRGVEHQEASTTGSDEFPPQSPVAHTAVVPLVDLWARNALRAGSLTLPMAVHNAAELVEIAALEGVFGPVAEFLNEVEIFHHGGILLKAAIVLVFEYCRRRAHESREK